MSTAKIAALNDVFRVTGKGGRFYVTPGIFDIGLTKDQRAELIAMLQTFNEFTPDNDPHGEHDFGAFEFANNKFFWKIDYYDKSMEFGSEDPADPLQTTRVLTLMLASEY